MTDTNKTTSTGGTSASPKISARDYFQVYTPFQDTAGKLLASPLLVPPKVASGGTIQVQVRRVCQILPAGIPAKTPPSPQLPIAIDNPDFTLAWSGSLTKRDLAPRELNVTLTIKNANAWKADPAAQSALRSNFDDFCRKVEGLELNDGVLIEGGAALLIRR